MTTTDAPAVAPPSAFAFWAENNRLPHLGDPIAPWGK